MGNIQYEYSVLPHHFFATILLELQQKGSTTARLARLLRVSWRLCDVGGAVLLGYGVLNAFLYASLIPLWEGFDEPFHYAYVEHVAAFQSLPEMGRTTISREILASLHLSPGSEAVQKNLPWIVTWGNYFRWPASRRAALRHQLESLRHDPAPSADLNYEAHQAPLAYLILAVEDRTLANSNLVARVWLLRLLGAVSAVLLTGVALFSIAATLNIPRSYRHLLIFVVFSSQMFYASTTHICNDWLAIPLMALLIARCLALWERPGITNQLAVTAALVAGLLTKAYFLAMVPLVVFLFAALVAARRVSRREAALMSILSLACCLPWYARNFELYGSVSGMQEAIPRMSWNEFITSFVHLPWGRSLHKFVFDSIWTGNNSFASFSSLTISLFLLGLCVAAGSYVAVVLQRRGYLPDSERLIVAACALFCGALAYDAVLSYRFTQGQAISPSPWYTQAFAPVLLALLFSALRQFKKLGSGTALWITWLSAYICAATWWAKMVPLYGGYLGKHTSLIDLARWYSANAATIAGNLSDVGMTNPWIIAILMPVQTGATILLAVILTIDHLRSNPIWLKAA